MQEEAPMKKGSPDEKEEKKLKRLATDDGLKKLLAERAALEKKIARLKNIMTEKERKEDTQVKIWIGAFYVKFYSDCPEKLEKFEPAFRDFIGEKKQEVYERWKKKHLMTAQL